MSIESLATDPNFWIGGAITLLLCIWLLPNIFTVKTKKRRRR